MNFLAGTDMTHLLTGFCLGFATLWAILEVIAVAGKRTEPPPMHARRDIRGYQPLPPTRLDPPPTPAYKPARDPDFWDVAEPETGRVEYQFLGIGEREDER